jgi:predicted nuclease of restriction endonuclease-like (RecB) superfamily
MSKEPLNFNALVSLVEQTHQHFQRNAVKAVNISLTARNWLIGFYIVKFELNGDDRAKYGANLFPELAAKFKHIKGIDKRSLYRFKDFYKLYPHLQSEIAPLTHFLSHNETHSILGITSPHLEAKEKVGIASPQSINKLMVPADKILNNLSYSHIEILLQIADTLKRTFYEMACIKGTWSVKELKHQINTLAYERVGISSNTEIALEQLQSTIEPTNSNDAIKSIYTFDFLGLKSDSLLEEKDLEGLLLDHLQEFIQELGYGFCFEHRQKRLLFDDDYYFADLVFYHRILKCHVIVELKVDAFKHEYLSQLNTYVAYYNTNIKREDDNRAIGILLCTEKGKQLVEYATAGMDNNLFVSKYLLELPKKEELAAFIQKEISGLR